MAGALIEANGDMYLTGVIRALEQQHGSDHVTQERTLEIVSCKVL